MTTMSPRLSTNQKGTREERSRLQQTKDEAMPLSHQLSPSTFIVMVSSHFLCKIAMP